MNWSAEQEFCTLDMGEEKRSEAKGLSKEEAGRMWRRTSE